MPIIAIMRAEDGRLATSATFPTQAEADAHIALPTNVIRFPQAFTVSDSIGNPHEFLIDMAAQTVTIVPRQPPDYAAIDTATVDRMLLESGIMRAFALMMFELGKAGKTGDWSFFDSVTDKPTFKALFMGLIR